MMRFLKLYIFMIFLCVGALPAFAEDPLQLNVVLDSSAQYYPEIEVALAKISESEGGVKEALGSFDARVDSSYYDRFEGFYSGGISDTKIVKPFQTLGAQAYVGYRRADGDFPVYEDYFFTNDSGEANAGLSLSLLRNRNIDPARFKLRASEIELDQSRINLLNTKIDVQTKAYKAYLNWLARGYKYEVYQDLLKIAEDRQDALKQKAERGDVSEISVTENQQFILQRKETVLEAKRQFENAANFLSLFYRNEEGEPKIPDIKRLPKKFPPIVMKETALLKDEMNAIFLQRPEIQALENQKRLAQNNIELGENNIMPAVDLELASADDLGNEGIPPNARESSVRLTFSVPLQRRLGQGRIGQGEAIEKQAEVKKSLELDKLKVSLNNTINNINTAKGIFDISKQEIEVTQKMEDAERTMFDNGQSDFFLVNIREINKANARINNIDAQRNLFSFYVDYFATTLDTDALKIN